MTRHLRIAITVAAVIGAGSGLATVTPATAAGQSSLPKLAISASPSSLHVSRSTISAGRVEVDFSAMKGKYFAAAYEIVSFNGHFGFPQLQHAQRVEKAHEMQGGTLDKKGRKADAAVVKHVTYWGGAQTFPGTSSTLTTVLKPGTYTITNDSKRISRDPTTITVTGPAGATAAPKTSATIIAKGKDRFRGSKRLPAHGVVAFKNRSGDDHFVALIELKPGTTKHDVAKYLSAGDPKRPPFVIGEAPAVDLLSPGHAVTFTMNATKGSYLEACFVNDPKTGMEHIYMGMWRIVEVS